MYAGFDYGTSNCALGLCKDTQIKLLPMEGENPYIASALYALDRRLISKAVASHLAAGADQTQYCQLRERELLNAQAAEQELLLQPDDATWFMGSQAINHYIQNPGEGWFVKSPKSYLGSVGLRPEQIALFEDLVALMMTKVKSQAQAHSAAEIEQVVIGRPINFLGIGGEDSNRQAINILTASAKLAGFKKVEFFYEPFAAGIEYETTLHEDKTVLVLDVGGGTSDCSMIRMGPSLRSKLDRTDDFLAHAGIRVGGNDLDISLNYLELMLELGRNSHQKNGLFIPAHYYSCAAKINDINASTEFLSAQFARDIAALVNEAQHPELVKRLQTLQHYKLNFQLSQTAENCKIGLSEATTTKADLSYLEAELFREVTVDEFEHAIHKPLQSIVSIIDQVIAEAGTQPDIVYLTGGTSKSPSVRKFIQHKLGNIPIADGDYFGSVVSGLAIWAEKIYG